MWSFTVTRLGNPAGAGPSTLHNVTIVNDTLAYAVGAIYMTDSTGQPDFQPYALAIWQNGAWRIQKVPFTWQGQQVFVEIYTIVAFAPGEAWMDLVHWSGGAFTSSNADVGASGYMRAAWGSSPNHFYFVGDGGAIEMYDNGSWQHIHANTSLNFHDIYGADGKILAVASDPFTSLDRAVFEINGAQATPIPTDPISLPLFGIWFAHTGDLGVGLVPQEKLFTVGGGIYEKGPTDSQWNLNPMDSSLATFDGIRGNSINDYFVVGATIKHYNGRSWRDFTDELGVNHGGLWSIAMKGDLVVMVGNDAGYAVVAVGRR